MASGLAGTVAVVAGAGRGQGGAHAVRQTQEGSDVVAVSMPATADRHGDVLPLPMVEVSDVGDAVVHLAADSGRALTGVTLPVDAGFAAR